MRRFLVGAIAGISKRRLSASSTLVPFSAVPETRLRAIWRGKGTGGSRGRLGFVGMSILASMILAYPGVPAGAVTLSSDWLVPDYVQPVGRDLNSMAYDPVSQRVLNPNYGTDLSLEVYDKDSGAFVQSLPLSGGAFSSNAGFSVGASPAGNLYLSDSLRLYKLDSLSDSTVTAVQSIDAFENPCRNLSVVGAGANTYVAGTGSSDSGPIQIWKARDSSCAVFDPWRTITGAELNPVGAGKAGCALSPADGSSPPEWAAGCEAIGVYRQLRLFRYDSVAARYVHQTTVGGLASPFPCFDAAFDISAGYKPILAVLTTSGHSDPGASGYLTAAMVEVFEVNVWDGSLTSLATHDFTGQLNRIGQRGSIEIDSSAKKIYVSFRCEGGNNHVAMARLSYTLDPVDPSPTATPVPTLTPTPTATVPPTPTPDMLVVSGYEQPPQGLRGQEVIVDPGHGISWNAGWLAWDWQRPLIAGEREDWITAYFCNRWLMPYLQNAGAMVRSTRERDEGTDEVITDFNTLADPPALTGTWSQTSTGTPYGGGAIATSSTLETDPTASVIYRCSIPHSGYYCLYEWHPAHPGASRAVPHVITDGAGNTHTYVLDQTQKTERWNYLDRFYFEAGADVPILEIRNNDGAGGQTVLADAIRIGGGMGSTDWGGGVSGYPRWLEYSMAWLRTMGAPSWVWNKPDWNWDYTARQDYRDWDAPGKLLLFIHSNAATGVASGSYAIFYSADASDQAGLFNLYSRMVANLQEDWDPTWQKRNPTDNAGTGWEPSLVIELAFHDNVARDLIYLMDPDFRRIAARGVYCGVVDYLTNSTGVYLPEPPSAPYATCMGNGDIRVGWKPPLTGPSPSTYRVYASEHPFGFGEYTEVAGSTLSVDLSLASDRAWYIQVRASNEGGVSFPTETLAVHNASGARRVLIVNGFDRLDWDVQETDNTRDFVRQHLAALVDSGQPWAVSSASNEAVTRGLISLTEYDMVDWILGKECRRYDITQDKGQADDRSFSISEQQALMDYLAAGGKVFLSGSDFAWDLVTKGSPEDAAFLSGSLHCSYVEDTAGSYFVEGTAGEFAGIVLQLDDGSHGVYDVESPDVIAATGSARSVLYYQSLPKVAGITRVSGGSGLVLFAFPFEAIVGESERAAVMRGVVDTLHPAPACARTFMLYE